MAGSTRYVDLLKFIQISNIRYVVHWIKMYISFNMSG